MKMRAMIWVVALLWLPGIAVAQERSVEFYGFIDMEYEYADSKDSSTFEIHHFNVINSYSFEQFRVFSEVEWEHGPKIEGTEGEGEITLERAWFEYLYNDRLKIRCNPGARIGHTEKTGL